MRRHGTFSVILVNLGLKTNTFSKGTRVGVAEPHTGEARPLFQGGLLAVQQELAAPQELDNEATTTGAEGTSEPPLVPLAKEQETPEVNSAGVPKDLAGKEYGRLDQFRGLWSGILGMLNDTTHHIQLKQNAKPVYSAQYRAGPHRSREIEKQVKTVLNLGVIEPSDAEWFFPVVVVQTPGGHFRFCADYRRLNKRTLNDVYPIPRINDILNSLGDATVFSTRDCTVGFWNIPVAAEDREKTTFTSHTGLFPFFRLLIGRVKAPASFQGALDIILCGIHWQTWLLYRYDVIVIYRTVFDHIQHLLEVLVLQGKAGFSLKPSKCHLFHQEFEYLGQVVRPGRLRGNQKNIKSLPQVLFPLNHTELKSFLCMCNMYRRIIEDYAHITKPLTELTSHKLPHVLPTLDAAQIEAVQYLKERLTSTSILALPRSEGLFILDTDACAVQVGCTPSAATRQDHSSGRILNPGPHPGRIKQL